MVLILTTLYPVAARKGQWGSDVGMNVNQEMPGILMFFDMMFYNLDTAVTLKGE